jgi:hypothetical protein
MKHSFRKLSKWERRIQRFQWWCYRTTDWKVGIGMLFFFLAYLKFIVPLMKP